MEIRVEWMNRSYLVLLAVVVEVDKDQNAPPVS